MCAIENKVGSFGMGMYALLVMYSAIARFERLKTQTD